MRLICLATDCKNNRYNHCIVNEELVIDKRVGANIAECTRYKSQPDQVVEDTLENIPEKVT